MTLFFLCEARRTIRTIRRVSDRRRFCSYYCIFIQTMLVLKLPMLIPMLMMLALTLMLLLNAFDAAAYAAADNAIADAKMPNVARHLADAYAVLLLPPSLPMMILLKQLLRADACDGVMLKCVCICVCMCPLPVFVCCFYMCPCACVQLLQQLHYKVRLF